MPDDYEVIADPVFHLPELMTQQKTEQALTPEEVIDKIPDLTAPNFAPNPESPLIAVYCLWQDDDWIEASIRSIYPYARTIICLFNTHPWAGLGTYDSQTEQIVKGLSDPEKKIQIICDDWNDAEWGGQLLQRSTGFDFCDEGAWYWLVDGDEVYPSKTCDDILDWCRKTEAYVGRVPAVSFWQDCYTEAWREHMGRLFRYRSGVQFVRPNTVEYPADKKG